VLDPVLQLDELALQAEQLLEIELTVERGMPAIGGLCRSELVQLAIAQFQLKLFVETCRGGPRGSVRAGPRRCWYPSSGLSLGLIGPQICRDP
jgi:hypothetical protein